MRQGLRFAVKVADEIHRRIATPFVSRGDARWCSICGWTGSRFLPAGEPPGRRAEAQCARCGSRERHRFAHHLVRDWPRAASTLHVAPEPQTAHFLQERSDDYLSIDLRGGRAMRQEDLTSLTLPDASFDLVFCSHVLEHIPDDRAAIREMRRVLVPSGLLILMVPVSGAATDEEVLDDPEERYRRYGLADHVRMYGLDVIQRLEIYFGVRHHVTTELPPVERVRLGLHETEEHAFICTAV